MISIFIYNIFLIILYSVTMTLAFYSYFKTQKKFFLFTSFYFVVLTLDNVIIYMTEFIHPFAQSYDRLFMVLPLSKTIILWSYACLALLLCMDLLKRKLQPYQLFLLITLAVYLLLVPFFFSGALKIWLYYLPSQLFTLYLGCALFISKKQKLVPTDTQKIVHILAYLLILASFFILIEDTFVIFYVDQYSPLQITMNNRSISEDIFSIIGCFLFLFYTHKELAAPPILNTSVAPTAQNPEQLLLFCEHFHLTQREIEIFALLYQHYSNQEIADRLFLSLGTVKTHVHNIFVKLTIHKRKQIYPRYEDFFSESK